MASQLILGSWSLFFAREGHALGVVGMRQRSTQRRAKERLPDAQIDDMFILGWQVRGVERGRSGSETCSGILMGSTSRRSTDHSEASKRLIES